MGCREGSSKPASMSLTDPSISSLHCLHCCVCECACVSVVVGASSWTPLVIICLLHSLLTGLHLVGLSGSESGIVMETLTVMRQICSILLVAVRKE